MQAAMDQKFSDVLLLYVIGAQRAGTTWMHQLFARNQEQVLVQAQKEVDFWNIHFGPRHESIPRRAKLKALRASYKTCFGLLPSAKYDYQPRRRHYLALNQDFPAALEPYGQFLFHGWRGQPVVADVSPNYSLLDPDAIRQMTEFHDSRFLVVLRDPVDRAVSSVKYRMLVDGTQPEEFPDRLVAFSQSVDPYGDYATLFEKLDQILPQDRLLTLFYETMFSQETAAKITSFLQLGSPLSVPTERVNESADVGRPSDDMLRRLADVYSDVYTYCHARFGGELPPRWHQNRALAAGGED